MASTSFPEGKYMAPVKVGPKGQIVIPAEVREMFGIRPGDTLLLLADLARGIALPAPAQAQEIVDEITRNMMQGGMPG
ncbi:MAG: AbrB/MazE/SpoVT family DNA-binding domain-containing protein [Faecousia sp.]